METRKITVVSTRDQKKSVIMTNATTLAELKSALRDNNIDYSGMTFYEGVSKTELKTDDSILPHDVPFKGQNTNELVFMLTNANKNIKSGAFLTRKEVAEYLKDNKEVAKAFKEAYGKNWTNSSTEDILAFINSLPESNENKEEFVDVNAREAIRRITKTLYYEGYFDGTSYAKINDILDGNGSSDLESSYSEEEIDEMFSDMK